jgi:hypothetical protein
VTKEKIDTVLERLHRLGLGKDDGLLLISRSQQIVSELMDDIRDAVIDYQVSGDPKPFLRAPFRQPV